MKTKYYIFMAFMLTLSSVKAQTVKWSLTPTYDDISYYSEDVLKCMKDGKIHLCDYNGKEFLTKAVDSVTNYEGGYALALTHEGNRYAIVGFLSEKKGHAFQRVTEGYYASKYSFFSEGFIVVVNDEGKMGYMNDEGQLVIPCQYLEARPYSHGYASVVVKKRKDGLYDVNYINKNGRTNGPVGFSSQLTYGTTFNEEGQAVVGDHSRFAIINDKFNVIKSTNVPDKNTVCSYDYSFVSDGKGRFRTNGNKPPQKDDSYQTVSINGRYAYAVKSGEVIVPAQFDDAHYFANDYAIAAIGDKYGVLKLLQGKFEPTWPNESIRVYYGLKCKNQRFMLQVPSTLDKVSLDFDCGNGIERKESYNFTFEPVIEQDATKCTFKARVVSSDGLLLWEETESVELQFVNIGVSKPVVTSKYADENDNQVVKATISNNSKIPVKVNATLKVDGKRNSINETLAPGQSKSLTVTVKVTQEKNGKSENASVSVKVDDSFDVPGSSSSVKFQLI